mmetsp:Transcript_29523/g.85424  ORF Transcript_29523/g.85424 Transcript_29523/m.85424 type:complete len:81 (+) Transcript_29523:97-339(+)
MPATTRHGSGSVKTKTSSSAMLSVLNVPRTCHLSCHYCVLIAGCHAPSRLHQLMAEGIQTAQGRRGIVSFSSSISISSRC